MQIVTALLCLQGFNEGTKKVGSTGSSGTSPRNKLIIEEKSQVTVVRN